MKKFIGLLVALCMVFTFAACSSTGTGSTATESATTESTGSSDTLVIGTISPNTGSLAAYGTAVTTGVDLAVSEINAAGGVLGMQIEVINADDQFDPTECLNAFNSLVAQGVDLIVGSVTSGCTSAITDAANEEGVVLISPSSTADSITTEDDYVFRACYADSFQGKIAAYYASQEGYDEVGVVYCSADTYSKGLYDSFAAACEEYGIDIVASESTASMDVQDFTNQFTAMVNADVEFVYAPFYYDVIGPYLVTQARAAGYEGIIMGADGYDGTPNYVVEGANLDAFNNVYWTNHFDPAATDPIVVDFIAAYDEMFGGDAPNAITALAYDAVYMLKTAIENAGSADAAAVRDALADTSVVYEGVTGTFSVDETGTPVKGAYIISFTSDGTTVSSKLVDVIKELK